MTKQEAKSIAKNLVADAAAKLAHDLDAYKRVQHLTNNERSKIVEALDQISIRFESEGLRPEDYKRS